MDANLVLEKKLSTEREAHRRVLKAATEKHPRLEAQIRKLGQDVYD